MRKGGGAERSTGGRKDPPKERGIYAGRFPSQRRFAGLYRRFAAVPSPAPWIERQDFPEFSRIWPNSLILLVFSPVRTSVSRMFANSRIPESPAAARDGAECWG